MKVLGAILGFFTAVLILGLLAYYLFMPFNLIEFTPNSGNFNFSLNSSVPMEMLFYPNLRYASSSISYNIDMSLCTLQKQDDMMRALDIIQNLTILKFYSAVSGADILITCDEKVVVNENYFVAGEGGPTDITRSGNFNVIHEGKILLLKESKCPNPNIATHELLHALGFNHSRNENNIMYPVTTCRETIGEDIPALINALYSVPSYPDLILENASAIIHGRYLDTNISIANNGLIDSGNSELIILGDNSEIMREAIAPLNAGGGIAFTFKNIHVQNTGITELEYILQYDSDEIDKANNQINLKIKN
jgi:hypothetical protein